tara:strand:+ start:1123 stop:2682 length:1560 start_codon:yes stop_codon:yes gene_type:complete
MATQRFLKPFLVKKEDKNNGLTHTLLDGWNGGKVRIPEDRYNEFLVAYATDIQNGVPLFVNELRRHTFRMFLDLDIVWNSKLSDDEIQEVMKVVFESFTRFFPDMTYKDQFLCIVSDACPKSICVDQRSLQSLMKDEESLQKYIDPSLSPYEAINVEDTQNRIWDYTYDTIFKLSDGRCFRNTHKDNGNLKHGIHAVFPHIIVTMHEALYMREALVIALSNHFGDKYAIKGWSHVVDNAVYVNSGLRMIYSQKARNCDVCKNKNRGKDCDFCANGKDLSEGRPYKLRFVCSDGVYNDEITKELQNNMIRLLSYAILYTSQCKVSENWKKYAGCPSYGDIVETKNNGPPKLASKERMFNEEKKTTRGWKSKTPVQDTLIIKTFERHIRERFVKEYKNLRVKSVVKDDKQYYISVDGEGSNFCLNLNPPRDHNSNRIWFSAQADGIRVRCFCPKMETEGRHLGYCKDFKTPPRPFNTKDMAVLFPQKSKPTNVLFQNPSSYLIKMQEELFQEAPYAKKMKK